MTAGGGVEWNCGGGVTVASGGAAKSGGRGPTGGGVCAGGVGAGANAVSVGAGGGGSGGCFGTSFSSDCGGGPAMSFGASAEGRTWVGLSAVISAGGRRPSIAGAG